VKFSRNGGAINISCAAGPAEATISIKDSGEGIPPEFLPYVFERFRQADASKTRSHGGLGLGLALVKNFVEGHHGVIEVASDGADQGSAFTVRLPLQSIAMPQPADDAADLKTYPDLQGARLLIVEDEPDTLEMMKAALGAGGYQITPCSSAASALELARGQQFDLIISDIGMPQIDGNELMRQLRRNPCLQATPAIAVSGYAAKKDTDAALASGFNAHLAKPIDPDQLAAIVRQLLRNQPSTR
jgi:CheY-like chemotaxis protein